MAEPWEAAPIAPQSGGGEEPWAAAPAVGTKGYKFSDAAITSALKKPGTSTVWMKPDQYLSLTPDLPSNPRTDKKGASLKASLDKGDQVDEVPSLDVTVGKDGTGKVVDQDGRHRAQFAKDAGVDLIPVAVKRSGEKGQIKNLAGMKPEPKPEEIFERNKAYAKPGATDFKTKLSPTEEVEFQKYMADKSDKTDLGRTDDQTYDMRGWWKAHQAGDPRAATRVGEDGKVHRNDYWKTPYHPSFSAESQWAGQGAPKWNDKDQLVAPDGKVVFDERAKPGVVPFNFNSVVPPQKIKPGAQSGPAAQKGAPRWDVLGDIGRAAEGAVAATGADLKAAFPDPSKEDLNPVATVKRMGHALRLPLDLAGIVLSPVTGAAHGIAGSALSYAVPRKLPAMQVTGYHPFEPGGLNPLSDKYRKMVDVDPKEQADQRIDEMMMAIAPEKGGPLPARNVLAATQKTQRAEAVLRNKAIDKVNQRAAEDGLTAQEVMDKQKEATAAGDKLTLMDLGKKNVRGLAGAVHRAPGQAGAEIDAFLEARDKAVSDALTSEIHGGIAKGSTFNAMKGLFSARTAASKPAFDAAFAADSLAPFESQFRTELTAATGTKGQIARQIADIEKNNSGALTSRGAAGAEVREKYTALHQRLEQAEADRQAAMKVFQKAKADGTANAPGAIWSPRLQEFMDNQEIQSGLKKALKLEKQDSVSERRPFKDTDFGIVGTDAEGEPIIGAVPTMKSLAVAKEGLDARIADLKDPLTGRPTKAGLSLKKFRDEFVKELYRLNPRYKTAVDAWSGPSQSVDAIKEGRTHFSRSESNEEVKADFDALTKSDKEFYRLGAAEAKIHQLESAADASDKTKRVINSERDRKRFRMLFDSDAAAQKFIESVERKRQMFDTKTAIKGGSHTAGRIAEDEHEGVSAGLHGAHAVAHAASGNWLGAISSALRAKRDLGLVNNPALNSEIAKYLTDPNLQIAPSSGNALLSRTPLPGVQNQLARGIFRAAHVNGLRALTMPQAATQPPQGQ